RLTWARRASCPRRRRPSSAPPSAPGTPSPARPWVCRRPRGPARRPAGGRAPSRVCASPGPPTVVGFRNGSIIAPGAAADKGKPAPRKATRGGTARVPPLRVVTGECLLLRRRLGGGDGRAGGGRRAADGAARARARAAAVAAAAVAAAVAAAAAEPLAQQPVPQARPALAGPLQAEPADALALLHAHRHPLA